MQMSVDQYPWLYNFYDPVLFDSNAGDSDSAATVAHYRSELADTKRSVLDVGCGTGRLALVLIEDGHSVFGIDNSAAMLTHLEAKAARLSSEARSRLTWQTGDFLNATPSGQFDALIAPDDFVTHFDLAGLAQFFRQARECLRPGGILLTDMRERSEARLVAAALPFPKPIQTYGLTGKVSTEEGSRHIAMSGWEEYDLQSRRLYSHQLFAFIRPDGQEEKRVWKTILQYNHVNADLVGAAQQAGFIVEQISGRKDAAVVSEQGGFFRLRRL
jgi:SAM-dependent methyltransferase